MTEKKLPPKFGQKPGIEHTQILPLTIVTSSDGKLEPDFIWGPQRDEDQIIGIIIHTMWNKNGIGDEQYDPAKCINLLINTQQGLSSHYFIDKAGNKISSVYEFLTAWAAGKSTRSGQKEEGVVSLNSKTIHIENIANEVDGLTQAQYVSVVELVADIIDRFPIEYVLGHSDVATIEVRDDPKDDPWNFDWPKFLVMLHAVIGDERYAAIEFPKHAKK